MQQTDGDPVAGASRRRRADAAEIAKFDRLAERWWDPKGPMRGLHAMNPARTRWVMRRIRRRLPGRPPRVLDIGCGAGLLAESLAQEGCRVTAIDAAGEAVAAARRHAAEGGLSIDYRVAEAEELAEAGERFDVVTALEVIEHVGDQQGFMDTVARLLAPGGLAFVSTLNRTPASYLAAKVAAEYLLGLLPVGTHDWRNFVTPAELRSLCSRAGLRLEEVSGMAPDPLMRGFHETRITQVNYIAMAQGAMAQGAMAQGAMAQGAMA